MCVSSTFSKLINFDKSTFENVQNIEKVNSYPCEELSVCQGDRTKQTHSFTNDVHGS